ncbi:MAG: Asp23/Gls24 family envelope stress response protein [Chloroflexia bacterium]|nr:Asp23/Gls24 family envelope stress response protein [Chloroflexia bacterium]
MDQELGSVRVSPQVVAAIIALSAAGVAGVAWLNTRSGQRRPLRLPEEMGRAVRVDVQDGDVQADIYLTADRNVHLLNLGKSVQQEVGDAIQRMLGLGIKAINVYIVDIVR